MISLPSQFHHAISHHTFPFIHSSSLAPVMLAENLSPANDTHIPKSLTRHHLDLQAHSFTPSPAQKPPPHSLSINTFRQETPASLLASSDDIDAALAYGTVSCSDSLAFLG